MNDNQPIGSLDDIYDAPDGDVEIEQEQTVTTSEEADSQNAELTEDQSSAGDSEEQSGVESATSSAAPDPIVAELARLAELNVSPAQLAAMGTTPSAFLAEVDRQAAQLSQQQAQTTLTESMRPRAEELIAAVAAGELTEAAADRIFEAEWKAAQAEAKVSQAESRAQALEATQQAAERDRQVGRIAAEFPGIPEADLRELASEGLSLEKIRTHASKVSALLAAKEQDATARYAARKEGDKKAHVPTRGDGAKETVSTGRETFDDIWD